MKYFNNNNLVKITLVYWLLLVLVETFLHPFTTRRIGERQNGTLFNEVIIEWTLIFNVSIFVPLVVIAIIKILQWKK
jgi:hypothetical protein